MRMNLSDLKVGMSLGEDIEFKGRIILRTGSELSEKNIKIFKTWGITEVHIVDSDVPSEDLESIGVSEEEIERIEKTIEKRFERANKDNVIIQELMKKSKKIELDRALNESKSK